MNRVCETLGIKYPVVQSAMAWICNAEMIAAVSNAGGMGVLASNNGQASVTNDPIETAERMRDQIRKVRSLTDKPFALNYLSVPEGAEDTDIFGRPMLEMAYEEGIKYVLMCNCINRNTIRELKDHGIKVIFRDISPTPETAKMAEDAGADVIIATGYDEGGFIPAHAIGTMSIVPVIVDAVSVPVLAAGGIADKRGVKAAFALGAEGVYVGTRFICSTECPAAQAVKEDIVKHSSQDLLFFKSGYTYLRSTPHKLAQKMKEMTDAGATHAEINSQISPGGILRVGMLEGKMDEGVVSVGNGIDLIHDIKSCEEIIHDLIDGVDF